MWSKSYILNYLYVENLISLNTLICNKSYILKEGVHEKMKPLLKDQLHLMLWPIGLFLLKNISSSSGSNSGKKLHIQWSILPHPVVCTSTSGGLYSHIHGLYSHIRRSVLPHPVVYTSVFQQSIQAVII